MESLARMIGWLAMGIFLVSVGCGQQEKPSATGPGGKPESGAQVGQQSPATPSGPEQPGGPSETVLPTKQPSPPPPPTIPKVAMDQTRRSTFRVWVGDQLPAGQLLDLQGRQVALESLWGEKLTIVVFWNSQSLSGLQQLQDLAKDLLPKYQEKGGRAVAVHVGGEASEVQKVLPTAASGLPVLVDPNSAYFTRIAQPSAKGEVELLPRTYVVDAQGKVLWLDIGYTESTLRGVEMSIRAVLGPLETGR
ncbi:MAG TPA: TlpA disulfide reductase family protein [Thermoguttaceae bacterium]|nr:TlpA disulfide reductase family protein [Thermoguttaceae bacterium]